MLSEGNLERLWERECSGVFAVPESLFDTVEPVASVRLEVEAILF